MDVSNATTTKKNLPHSKGIKPYLVAFDKHWYGDAFLVHLSRRLRLKCTISDHALSVVSRR